MAKKHVILFAGTTEGRILANWLDEQSGVTGIVCVATEYGEIVMREQTESTKTVQSFWKKKCL